MRRTIFIWVGLLLLAIPRPGQAQTDEAPSRFPSGENGPIQTLLDHREEFGLTSAQVDRLRAMQSRVVERNRPLVQRFLEIRRRWERERPANWRTLPPARRRQIQERFQGTIRAESRALEEQVQTNHRAAMLEVRAMLTREQRQKLRSFLEDAPMLSSPVPGPGAEPSLRIPSR